MPRIIEGRRRGAGVGTMGIRGGYHRRDNEDKPYWPAEPAQAPNPATTVPNANAKPQTSLLAQDAKDRQATIEAAKQAFLKRKPRKKKRTVLSSTGGLDDEAFSFASKPKRKPSVTPQVSTTTKSEKAHLPLVTPALVVPVAEQDHAVTKATTPRAKASPHESRTAWQSPRPHSAQKSSQETQQMELQALKEKHRVEMQEKIRNHKKEMETQTQKHAAETQKLQLLCQEKDARIKDLHNKRALSDKAKDEEHAKAIKEAVELVRKNMNEEHAKAIKETVETVEEKHSIREKIKEEEHSKSLKKAVELERSNLNFKREEDEINHRQQLGYLQKELEARKKQQEDSERDKTKYLSGNQLQSNPVSSSAMDNQHQQDRHANSRHTETEIMQHQIEELALAQQQRAREEHDRKRATIKEESSYFSKDGDQSSPPLIRRFPLVDHFTTMSQSSHADSKASQHSPSVVSSANGTNQNQQYLFRSSATTPGAKSLASQNQNQQSPSSISLASGSNQSQQSPSITSCANGPNESPQFSPYRSSSHSFKQPGHRRKNAKASPTVSVCAASSVLLELKSNVGNNCGKGETRAQETKVVPDTMPTATGERPQKGTQSSGERSQKGTQSAGSGRTTKGSPFVPLDIKQVSRSKSPPPSTKTTSSRKAAVQRTSSRKRLRELVPKFQMPAGVLGDVKRRKKAKAWHRA